MKKILLVCCLALAAFFVFAVAGPMDSEKLGASPDTQFPMVVPMGSETPQSVVTDADLITRMDIKTRYYELLARYDSGIATDREIAEINDLSFSFDLPLPESMLPVEDPARNPLDQGGVDTLANCASATVIPSCPYDDAGAMDGDNDCSAVSAYPYNEVFYTFTAPATGYYQMRARSYSGGNAAIRVVSGGCCAGAVGVAASSSSVAGECENGITSAFTYLRATLTAGTQYWIHVGTASTTSSTANYEFNFRCVPCPNPELDGASHNTCATAQAIAVNDSLLGDSSTSTTPDYYTFTMTGRDSVAIYVGGRAFGHCISGLYPGGTGVDGRFTLYRDNGSGCPGDSIGFDDDSGCSFDAYKVFCLSAGTYYLKVWCYSNLEYVLKVSVVADCPEPIDCAAIQPCGAPFEIEPNNACADIANFLTVPACGERAYGVICQTAEPQVNDIDYWYVPATVPPARVTVLVKDGEGCNTYPPAGIGVKLAGTTTCAAPSGSTYSGFIFGGCTAWPGGYIAVVRFAGVPAAYALETSCDEPACPNVQVPNQVCSGPCVGPIPDDPSVAYSLIVPTEYHITDVNVRVDIVHTYDADIDMWLVSPWADSIELTTDNGGSGDNFQVTVFDDEGANGPVTAGTAPFNGSYIPEELLAGLDGFNALGTWQLVIDDDAGGDVGYVNCWCLEFEYDYILAVRLNNFSAIAGDGRVELSWTTASESDNDHFELVRDGNTVANVAATNNSSGSTYSWTDDQVTNGATYTYTLVAVDVNGGRTELATQSATPEGAPVITEYALHQNYPNPFNPTTSITFDLVEGGFVNLKVYNMLGQEIATVVNGVRDAGRHAVTFDATNLPSGLYLYRIEANGFVSQHKMLLMK